jgi:hypothetical protein
MSSEKCQRHGCDHYVWPNDRGRPRKYCSDICRKAAHGDREALRAAEERADFILACIVEGRSHCRRGA